MESAATEPNQAPAEAGSTRAAARRANYEDGRSWFIYNTNHRMWPCAIASLAQESLVLSKVHYTGHVRDRVDRHAFALTSSDAAAFLPKATHSSEPNFN